MNLLPSGAGSHAVNRNAWVAPCHIALASTTTRREEKGLGSNDVLCVPGQPLRPPPGKRRPPTTGIVRSFQACPGCWSPNRNTVRLWCDGSAVRFTFEISKTQKEDGTEGETLGSESTNLFWGFAASATRRRESSLRGYPPP